MATVTRSQTRGTITLTGITTTFFAEILDMSWSGIKRDVIDVSNMSLTAPTQGTSSPFSYGNKIFIPSFYVDPGELTIDISFNPDVLMPIANAAGTVTIALGADTLTQATWAASGFFYDFSFKLPLDGKQMTCSAKLKFTSTITATAGT